MSTCKECNSPTIPIATISKGLGHAEHYHYCNTCKVTQIVRLEISKGE
jgi:RNase P subunit RPR2